MKIFITSLLFFCVTTVQAKVEVLFHPHDPTLEKIASWISEAQSNIDIAMYNLDTTASSPIIQVLQSPQIQERLSSGQLKIRMILELYGTPDENTKKRQAIENLGVDVRYLNYPVKVHHKFAIIDPHSSKDRVITGSANWSVSSYRNYDENILFITQEPEVTGRYQTEFNRLWVHSTEFGKTGGFTEVMPISFPDQKDLEIYFNSPKKIPTQISEDSDLTSQIVNLIDSAQSHIEIATTRIRLTPILEAVKKAANRGIKIQILISQDDFMDLYKRASYLLNNPNIELRIKFYNLHVSDYLSYQMHNKFMIVDGKIILTGSFNWSLSSENGHIENIIVLKEDLAKEVMSPFQSEFSSIWTLGREEFPVLVEALKNHIHPGCEIPKMALSFDEIKELLSLQPSCK